MEIGRVVGGRLSSREIVFLMGVIVCPRVASISRSQSVEGARALSKVMFTLAFTG